MEDILEVHGAGSPTDLDVLWTDLKPMQLASEPMRRGFEIARNTAARLLDRAGYRRCSLRKELITGKVDPHQRDQQFHHIDALRRQASAHGNPGSASTPRKKSCAAICIVPVRATARMCNASTTMISATLPTLYLKAIEQTTTV